MGSRLLVALPSFLRHPITPTQARVALARRVERREELFLATARAAIFANPASPYRRLLALAGCEEGDLRRMVRRDGVESALERLFRQGVYLTVDEYKGRRPVLRGSARLNVRPTQLRRPGVANLVPTFSGGSRGPRSPTPVDLAHIHQRAVDLGLFMAARGGFSWQHAMWAVPGGIAITRLIESSRAGLPMARWFSAIDPTNRRLHVRYRWIGRILSLAGLLANVPQPRPIHAPLDNPLPIVRWLSDVLLAGGTPHLQGNSSPVVRLCQAASAAGLDLSGAQFLLSSEPCTAARLAAIRRVGAKAIPAYAVSEAGRVAFGCLDPRAPDDMHFSADQFAVIQPGDARAGSQLPANAMLLSTILPTAPLTLLNVSLGDQARFDRRSCDCAMDLPGRGTHLHTVRSFEKLTAGGMTFLDVDMIRVLEHLLPNRFGGGPTHYQLVESETDDGRPDLQLLIHPSVEPLDTVAVAEAFLDAIGHGNEGERLMALQWRQAGLPRVVRREPLSTATGKVLHLHADQRTAPPA